MNLFNNIYNWYYNIKSISIFERKILDNYKLRDKQLYVDELLFNIDNTVLNSVRNNVVITSIENNNSNIRFNINNEALYNSPLKVKQSVLNSFK